MCKAIVLAVVAFVLAAGPVWAADGIAGRLGMTVKAGILVPLRDEMIDTTSGSRPSLAYGGGILYGFTPHLAGEVDVSHAPSLQIKQAGQKVGEASLTHIALGVQYRVIPDARVVPYLGAGLDVIKGEFTNNGGQKFVLDWTYGGYIGAGIDVFLTRGVAFTADVKGVYAAPGGMGSTRLDYDPTSVVGTVGFRLFLPEHLFL